MRMVASGWSSPFVDDLIFGANIKYYNNRLFDTTGTGFGFDLGLQYSLAKTLYLGAVVYNRLPINMNWSNGTSEVYPQRTRFGIGLKPIPDLLLSMDIDQDGSHAATNYYGAEYLFNPSLALRGGISPESYSVGIGLNLFNLILDMSYSTPIEANSLDSSLRLSVGAEW